MNIKKITQIAQEINANEDSPQFIEARGWKFNQLVKGSKIYGWLTDTEADTLKVALLLSAKS